MAAALTSGRAPMSPAELARLQFVLRFSFGTTASFILCEFMGWQPSALAPALTGVLLANLPTSPPPKVAIALIVVMALSAWFAFFLTAYLSQAPTLLFGIIALVLFLIFCGLAQAKAQLPLTLLLICITVVPVMTLTVAQYAGMLPGMLARAMAIAIAFTWIAYAIWPLPSPKAPDPPAPPSEAPVMTALLGTAIVLPVMFMYLLYGWTDAMPVLLTTALTVATMEEERGAASAWAKLMGNFTGGFVAVVAYYVLSVAPSLTTLALITFMIGFGFALLIVKGGVRGGNALIAYNATIVILGIGLLKGPSNSGTWSARVVQFAIACTFAAGMMYLLLPLAKRQVKAPEPD